MISYVGNLLYIKTDSIYKSLALSDSTKHYIYTESDKILVLNDQLKMINELDFKELYTRYLKENEIMK